MWCRSTCCLLQGSDKQSMLMASDSGDPVDMLEARAAGHAHSSASAGRQRPDSSDFARNSEGRMVIREEEVKKGVQLYPAIALVWSPGYCLTPGTSIVPWQCFR